MITALAMSFVAVATFYVTACRVIRLRRLLGYGMALDLVFTIGAFVFFHGTLTGLLIATIAGLVMAISISAGRALIGYDRAAAIYWTMRGPSIIWTHQPPKWKFWPQWKTKRAQRQHRKPTIASNQPEKA